MGTPGNDEKTSIRFASSRPHSIIAKKKNGRQVGVCRPFRKGGTKLKLHRVGWAWPNAFSDLAELNPIDVRRDLVSARRIDHQLDRVLASRNLHAGLSHRGPLLKAAGVDELERTGDVLAIDLQVERSAAERRRHPR